jgi:D-alanine-D-alanine ligase
LRGMSRTDVRVHEGIIYILDINTMPNLDTNSFLPFIAQSQGISLKELFTRILMRFEKVYHADSQFELV